MSSRSYKQGGTLPQAHVREMFAGVLKKAARFLEAVYGLTSYPTGTVLPQANPKATPARHFAAYLALSGVGARIWEVPDGETGEAVPLLITKPERGNQVKGFKAIKAAEWMKDVPDLVTGYRAAMRNKGSWCHTHDVKETGWFTQLSEGPEVFKKVIETAGEMAANEDVSINIAAALREPDTSSFDLFALYTPSAMASALNTTAANPSLLAGN